MAQGGLFQGNAGMAQALYRQLDEDGKDMLANLLFYRELDTIRRDQPLLDPNKFPVRTVALYDRDASQPAPNINLRGGAAPSPTRPVPLFQKGGCPQLPRILARVLAKMATFEVIPDDDDDADGTGSKPEPSGPLSNMRLDIPNIRKKLGYRQPFEQQFPMEVEAAKADFLTTGYEHTDEESMFQGADWLPYLRKCGTTSLLYKGFPMVEDVVFIKHPSFWSRISSHGKLVQSGQCYWLAVALLIYGNASCWLRVKAEHLSFVEKVLMNREHPRHAFYSKENKFDAVTQATGPAGLPGMWDGTANLWERLQIPGCWMSEDMCQLTADVYGVFVVLYKYCSAANLGWKDKIYDMKTYGAYNNRHIFMCYHGENHYQPMVPNDFYAYEFKLPRMTLQNTRKYRLVTRERRRLGGDGPKHHWRGNIQVAPSPLSRPSFEPEHLTRAAGYGPYVNKSLAQPQRSEKKEIDLLANPDLLESPKIVQQVTSLISGESTWATQRKPITQADVQATREALRVLREYVEQASARHPLPSSRPAPTSSYDPSDPKGKRPATDAPEPSTPPKRPRVDPPITPQSQTIAAPTRSLTPIDAPSTPGSAGSAIDPIPIDSDSDEEEESEEDDDADDDDDDAEDDDADDDTFFRTASKTLLNKIKIVRLKRWCRVLQLGAGADDVEGWKKDRCVVELLTVGAEVKMEWREGGSVVVDEVAEGRGVEVVRFPVAGEEGDEEEEEFSVG